ncbi:VPLPA-CTERM sorting domain-containing protein [Cereibacter sphaeroides]|uniref:VPLPA-CTERM sorting domain-containing protein n=1 Tax=Cereibacter sphaeroides TaxID=1063 RepID=UPI001F1A1FD2|nr:VPLPA-CTERM sorting domain-containing protein [Cereibacter sphaeroides]MCE6950281.1 VPLPA-CTERM sorting domain-containing protein [Cereibacter sphaeroides]
MFDLLRKTIVPAVAAAGFLAAAPAAQATPVNFVVGSDSAVSLTCEGTCSSTDGISAALASGLVGSSHAVEYGSPASFDFLTLTSFGVGTSNNYLIEAVLSFSEPDVAIPGGGGIFEVVVTGFVNVGGLVWDNFEKVVSVGDRLFKVSVANTTCSGASCGTVSAAAVSISEVPLPAGGLLLIGGLGALALMRRRQTLAA